MKYRLPAPLFLLLLVSPLLRSAEAVPASWPDPQTFAAPPDQYGVETFGQWINGNVTKEGLTKDLEAMRAQGITRDMVYFVAMGPKGPVNPLLSDVWLEHWRHTVSEADRLGLKLATHAGPGWSETGGPWIKPGNSMKRVVWSHQVVRGGRTVEGDLPPLPSSLGWSKDIAVLAWPESRPPSRMEGSSIQCNGKAVPGTALYDGNPSTGADLDDPTRWRLDMSFPSPHECDRAVLFVRWKKFDAARVKMRISAYADDQKIQEIVVDAFTGNVVIPFSSAIQASRLRLEGEYLGAIPPWCTLKNAQITEAELLTGAELPQWRSELENLAGQTGDAAAAGTPRWTKEESQPIQAGQIVDLTAKVDGGHLKWDAPAGNWRIVRFGFTTTGSKPSVPQESQEGPGLESDKMSAAATDLHFDSYIARLLQEIPAAQHGTLDVLELDSWEAGCQNWTDDLPAEFKRRRGYDLVAYLPVFAGAVVGSRPETERFLNDFRETIAELIAERFYGRLAERLHQRHIQLEAEISDRDIPLSDTFAIARLVDLPMDEFWSDKADGSFPPLEDKPPRGTLVPEAAFVAGKDIVPAESLTGQHAEFEWTPGDYGYLVNHALLWGYNRLNLHSYVHQPGDQGPGWTLGPHGQPFNRLNTWWPMIGGWLREIRRAQYLSQTSRPVYDVLVYQGDAMPRAHPEPAGLPAGCRALRLDHVALKQLRVKDGKLTLNGLDSYPSLIVPTSRLHAETVEIIAKLARDGALVAASRFGPAPGWSNHEDQDRRIEAVATAIWGGSGTVPPNPLSFGQGKIYASGPDGIRRLFADSGWRAPFLSSPSGNEGPLMVQHRRNGSADLFGLFNPNEGAVTYSCTVLDAANRAPEIWDMLTGRHWLVSNFTRENGALAFGLRIEGHRLLYLTLALSPSPGSSAEPPTGPPVDTFAISTPFTVAFQGLAGMPPQKIAVPGSWTDHPDPHIRDYSGIATYRTEFVLPPGHPLPGRQVFLDLGEVGKVARVTLNGTEIGTLWRAPWKLEAGAALRTGENTLQIDVANTWSNKLRAELVLPKEQQTLFLPNFDKGWFSTRLLSPEKSGLLGPVTFQFYPLP